MIDDVRATLVCMCMRIPEPVIVAAVRAGCRDSDGVLRQTGAASHCGECLEDIDEIILDVLSEDGDSGGR